MGEVDVVVGIEQGETPELPAHLRLSPPWSWGPRIYAQDPKTMHCLGRSPDALPVSDHSLGDTESLGSRAAPREAKNGLESYRDQSCVL